MREVREWERGGQRTFHPSLCRLPVSHPPPHSQPKSVRADVESRAYHTQLGLRAVVSVAICGIIIWSTIREKQNLSGKQTNDPTIKLVLAFLALYAYITDPRYMLLTSNVTFVKDFNKLLCLFVSTSQHQLDEDICVLTVTK